MKKDNRIPFFLAVITVLLGFNIFLIASTRFEIDLSSNGFVRGFLSACGDPCIIEDNHGGFVVDYLALASEVNKQKLPVLIGGVCASACALFADLARPNVYIRTSVEFRFHKSSLESDPKMSDDISNWVAAHGGFPSYAGGTTLHMPFFEARKFWPAVVGNSVLKVGQ